MYFRNELLSSISYHTSDLLIMTSSPTSPMYESRKIEAGFIFACNPNITWAMKVCPLCFRDPHQEFTITSTYPSLLVDHGVVSEVDVSCSFRISCRSVQDMN